MFIMPGSASPAELQASVKQGIRITALGRVPPLESPDTPFTIPFTGRWIHDGGLEAPLGGGYLAGTLRELLSEVKPGATFYSYTEGPRPIHLEARDRDLLQRRDEIMAKGGPKAWFEFLETEIARRKAQRAAAAKP